MTTDWTFPLQCLAKLLVPLGLIGQATDFTNVQYDNGHGTTLHAYLAKPSNFNASKTYPAAVVLHAWNGMGEEPVYFADLLAEQGYIVIAPDMFRNLATCELNIPWNVATVLLTPQDRIDGDVDAAISYLTSEAVGNVDSTMVFSGPGFCFGGSQALTLSIRRAMAGTVSLYGANINELQDASNDALWGELGVLDTQVLGIYGRDDGAPTPQEATGFQAALTARNIKNTVTIYDGVGHAFVNPQDHKSGMTQAVTAWNQVVAFMNGIVVASSSVGAAARRELDYEKHSHAHASAKVSRTSWAWIWDHTMDFFQRKGHFGHGHTHHHGHATHNDPSALRIAKEEQDDSVSGRGLNSPASASDRKNVQQSIRGKSMLDAHA